MKFIKISDPGHGWLKVPLKEIKPLKIGISYYSRQDNEFAYLEEDCDMPKYLDYLVANGIKFEIEDEYQENCPIRQMKTYINDF